MSGIAGTYNLDGRPLGRSALGRMAASMVHRGPDGISVWSEGPVGFGHCMLHTTAESLGEKLPCTDATGRFTITADARIDNREELLSL
ncbi:MAG TPA: asparagine synthetase B, partial [Rhodothermales bacterium]|nr:asparagine synthetase B [Rhodothermales bacterium]